MQTPTPPGSRRNSPPLSPRTASSESSTESPRNTPTQPGDGNNVGLGLNAVVPVAQGQRRRLEATFHWMLQDQNAPFDAPIPNSASEGLASEPSHSPRRADWFASEHPSLGSLIETTHEPSTTFEGLEKPQGTHTAKTAQNKIAQKNDARLERIKNKYSAAFPQYIENQDKNGISQIRFPLGKEAPEFLCTSQAMEFTFQCFCIQKLIGNLIPNLHFDSHELSHLTSLMGDALDQYAVSMNNATNESDRLRADHRLHSKLVDVLAPILATKIEEKHYPETMRKIQSKVNGAKYSKPSSDAWRRKE